MQKHRTTILMGLLLGLVGVYIFQSQQIPMPIRAVAEKVEPLDGENEIRDISVRNNRGIYYVEVDYRFRGDFWPGYLRSYVLQTTSSAPPKYPSTYTIKRGVGTAELYLERDTYNTVAHSTRVVRVEMYDLAKKQVVASKDLEYPIEWPRLGYSTEAPNDMGKDVDLLYKEAVAEIDYSTKKSLKNARKKLEIILSKDPRFVAAYPEIARYHMTTNWGPEGLRQAERALNSGLAIDLNHANSHVLIGYVYANQGRYQEAESAFTKAKQIGTDNLWLWANWGKLHLMQGQVMKSVAMYEKAIEGERPYNTYDRARKDAYRHLIDIYTLNNDINSTDELHLKRIAEYGNETCFPYHYAKFRQHHFDDADIVLEYAKKALDAHCQYEANVRKVIGAAYFSKWIAATTPEEEQSYLTQARLFFAEGPKLIYWLAHSEKTAPVIERLVGNDIAIDVTDNGGMTALAYAAKENDFEAVKRLIELGGNPNVGIGQDKIPLLAIAVISESKETVQYLVAHGADVSAQFYKGASLIDLAEGMGFTDIAEVLKNADAMRI